MRRAGVIILGRKDNPGRRMMQGPAYQNVTDTDTNAGAGRMAYWGELPWQIMRVTVIRSG